jgi:hypothetical protein
MAAKGSVSSWVRLRSTTGAWLAHPELRDRMIADAAEKGTNLTDLGNQILSQFFGVAYEPNRKRSVPQADKEQLNFGVSPELKAAIVRAYPNARSWHDSIRLVLCAHYGLRVPAKVKLTRQRRSSAAQAA